MTKSKKSAKKKTEKRETKSDATPTLEFDATAALDESTPEPEPDFAPALMPETDALGEGAYAGPNPAPPFEPAPEPKPAAPSTGERQLGVELRYDGNGATLVFVGDGATLTDPELASNMNSLLSAIGSILLAAGPPEQSEPIKRIEFHTPKLPGGPAAMKPFIRQALHSEGVKKPGG